MRLINVNTYAIQEFFGACIPEYAILSHTWAEEEVTFQDMQHLNEEVEAKLGFKKIKATCQQAQRDRLDWAWVDTCCIDKTSSAELTEAINSMFQWYTRSKVCYAFLADVGDLGDMSKSRWFTRGWTLQELLAPREVNFYSAQWTFLGCKTSVGTNFHSILVEASGIPRAHIEALTSFDPEHWTVAERMVWASKRQTTRVEDIAYCLLGIFNVNIPLLYGEGERAFRRLQEEIIRVSDDESLFAWADKDAIPELPCGFLARRPADFAHFAMDDSAPLKLILRTATDYRISNRGIRIRLHLVPLSRKEPTTFYAFPISALSLGRPIIIVRQIVGSNYYRIHADKLFRVSDISVLNFVKKEAQELILRQIEPPLRYLDTPKEGTTTLLVDYSQLVAPDGVVSLKISPTRARVTPTSFIYADWNGRRVALQFRWLDTNFNLHVDHDGSCILENITLPPRRPFLFRRLKGACELLLCEYEYKIRVIRAQSSLKSSGEGGHVRCIALHSLEITNWDHRCFRFSEWMSALCLYVLLTFLRPGFKVEATVVVAFYMFSLSGFEYYDRGTRRRHVCMSGVVLPLPRYLVT